MDEPVVFSPEDDPVYEKGVYWKKDSKDGPYCTRCWDKNRDWMRLKHNQGSIYVCPECKNEYNVKEK